MAGTKFSDISFAIWSRTLRSIAVSNTMAASTLSLARTYIAPAMSSGPFKSGAMIAISSFAAASVNSSR
jgi:hypothetical protein